MLKSQANWGFHNYKSPIMIYLATPEKRELAIILIEKNEKNHNPSDRVFDKPLQKTQQQQLLMLF